eukprot:TRINITY_DN2598_c0_g1_i1.p1 TRINITY_DN2598_c0_g1~~TRINITY_DN2598_c0_g1_i1.p1  ORF type:complete len:339 (+),score=62.45 TRINITY_DN2598_c0_g1_i1:90-1106(+)
MYKTRATLLAFCVALHASSATRREKCETEGQPTLSIRKVSATGLKNTSYFGIGKTDPFLKMTIGDTSKTTDAIPNALDPEWPDTKTYFENMPADIREIKLEVIDDNVLKDTLLGSASVDFRKGTEGQWNTVTTSLVKNGNTQGQITVEYNFQAGWQRAGGKQPAVHIKEISCTDLKNADSSWFGSGKTDAYFKVAVGKTTETTPTVEENLNPKWPDWEKQFNLTSEDDTIVLNLWDSDTVKHDLMGSAQVKFTDLQPNEWVTFDDLSIAKNGKTVGNVHFKLMWSPGYANLDPERAAELDTSTEEGKTYGAQSDSSAQRHMSWLALAAVPVLTSLLVV